MKLRLRSLETKQTHKIEVPNTCNLRQLKQAINLQIFSSSSSSSSTVEHDLLLSLNRKEELFGSSNEDSLQSVGVTSGDLIYFTLNPSAFSLQTPDLSHVNLKINNGTSDSNDQVVDLMNTHDVESGKFDESNDSNNNRVEIGGLMEEGSKLGNPRNDFGDLGKTQMVESSKDDELINSSDRILELIDTQVEGWSDYDEEISTDLVEGGDEMEIDDENEIKGNFRYSVPSFLKKVFVKEVGAAAANAANGGDHKLLMIAVHAVLLESGFVRYDPVSGMKVDGFHQRPSLALGMTLNYTLPEVSASEVVETVRLKFQFLGKYVKVYGFLPKKGYRVHRVCLDEPRFLPVLSFIWQRSDDTNSENEMIDGSRMLYPNQEIFEFWKMVKDGISYPLLIDLCEQLGIVSPPSFMRLPTELKLKILESLPARDVARVECVCSELRFVSSNNDLWRLKYEEEFGIVAASQRECQWKAEFRSAWVTRKKRKRRMFVPLPFKEPPHFRPLFPGRRDPILFGPPFVIGGDYDRLPGFGLPQHPGRRIFRRNCDLGGLGL